MNRTQNPKFIIIRSLLNYRRNFFASNPFVLLHVITQISMPKARQVSSMKDIAAQAGVSIMTVSRVLNGTGYASSKTSEHIRKIAEEMKYRPNRLVRGLQTGRTGMIGLMLPRDLAYYRDLLIGAHDYFCSNDSAIITSLVEGNMGEQALNDERRKLHRLVDLRVEGVIIRPMNEEASAAYFEEVVERGMPMVAVDRQFSQFACDFVGTDDRLGGRMAAELIAQRKPERVLILSAGSNISTSRDRVAGFREFFKNGNCDIHEHAFNSFYATEAEMKAVLKKHLPIDAIFCVGDLLAIRCLRILQKMKVSVPEDTGIVGFGNLGLPEDLGARITTFDQNPALVGQKAAELITSRIKAKASKWKAKSIIVPPTLVDMGTC